MNRPQTQPAKLGPLLAVLGLLLAMWFGLAPKASAVCLPQDHRDLFAANSSPGGHQETDALPPKNRVWKNFENPNEITPADELNSLQLRWESDFGELELASGVLSYADGNPISLSDPFGLEAIFLYGANDPGKDQDYFKRHTEAQAASFTQSRRPITGYTTMLSHHSPSPLVPVYGAPTEKAHVYPARNTEEFNHALKSVPNISNITYNGHAWGLGNNIKISELNKTNVKSDAKIYLNGCYTGYDDNNSGSFSAQRYANGFGVPARGISEGLSFGLPVPHVISNQYTDLSPGYLRGKGSFSAPSTVWAYPSNSATRINSNLK